MNRKVMVAMSGGVDSSVAAYLLKLEGFDVVGVTMCLGIKRDDASACCGAEAINDAKRVCDKLEIPHYVLDFSKDLEEKVIAPFADEYVLGRTPNPCVDCNKYLKFDALIKKAFALGFGYLATGHYAGMIEKDGDYFLTKAHDNPKDQSYFLYGIKKNLLKHIKFPLANLTKTQVRALAAQADLPVAQKKDSQDICFVMDRDYARIVEARKGKFKPGNIIDSDGKVLGRHKGIINYTIGQRQGLGIGGGKPLYVMALDAAHNNVIVGSKLDLLAKGLIVEDLNLFVKELPEQFLCKIRYNSKPVVAGAKAIRGGLEITFTSLVEAVTPGQAVVFYDGDIVLGGGTIAQVIK
jgi:tRNA-uridine 2-sulfurtransferase